MGKIVPPSIKKLAPAKQRRLDQLLEKNAVGTISAKEKERLEALVSEAEQLMIANSQQLAEFAQSQKPQPPSAAIPVTVWVSPQVAQR